MAGSTDQTAIVGNNRVPSLQQYASATVRGRGNDGVTSTEGGHGTITGGGIRGGDTEGGEHVRGATGQCQG